MISNPSAIHSTCEGPGHPGQLTGSPPSIENDLRVRFLGRAIIEGAKQNRALSEVGIVARVVLTSAPQKPEFRA